jgi:outer membrane lipoprotein carrier protein
MRWSICLVMLLLSQAAVAGGEEALKEFIKDLRGFQADFKQTITQGSKEEKSTGLLTLEKPGKFRWDYEKPNPHLVLADSNYVWIYDPDLEQVTRRKQATALQGTPAQVLVSDDPLDKSFEISGDSKEKGLEWVKLIPRDKDSQYDHIRLAFKGKDLDRIVIYDKFDQVTEIEFSKIERNPKLDWDFFLFEPPEGADIIDQ